MKSINASKIVALGAVLAIALATAGCSSHRGYYNDPYSGYNGNYSTSSYPYNQNYGGYSEQYYGGYNQNPAPTYTYRQQPANVTVYRSQPANVYVYRDGDAYRNHATPPVSRPYVHSDYDRVKPVQPKVEDNHRNKDSDHDSASHQKANHDHDYNSRRVASTERTEQD